MGWLRRLWSVFAQEKRDRAAHRSLYAGLAKNLRETAAEKPLS